MLRGMLLLALSSDVKNNKRIQHILISTLKERKYLLTSGGQVAGAEFAVMSEGLAFALPLPAGRSWGSP